MVWDESDTVRPIKVYLKKLLENLTRGWVIVGSVMSCLIQVPGNQRNRR